MKKRQVKFLEGEHGRQRSGEYLRDRGIYPAAMWCPKEGCPWVGGDCQMPLEADTQHSDLNL